MIYPHGINLYFPISIEKRICLIGLPEKDYLTYLNTLHAFDILEVGNTVLNCIPSHTTDDTFTDCYLASVCVHAGPSHVGFFLHVREDPARYFFWIQTKTAFACGCTISSSMYSSNYIFVTRFFIYLLQSTIY